MLEHWLIELIGHVSGLSDAQLKQIEKSLPATKALVDLLNRAQPIIEQARNLYPPPPTLSGRVSSGKCFADFGLTVRHHVKARAPCLIANC
jgi:hypothetical protein